MMEKKGQTYVNMTLLAEGREGRLEKDKLREARGM